MKSVIFYPYYARLRSATILSNSFGYRVVQYDWENTDFTDPTYSAWSKGKHCIAGHGYFRQKLWPPKLLTRGYLVPGSINNPLYSLI
jgi:hypothetical protein